MERYCTGRKYHNLTFHYGTVPYGKYGTNIVICYCPRERDFDWPRTAGMQPKNGGLPYSVTRRSVILV